MSGPVSIRAFRESDYEAVVALWQRTEGVEVAEGDERADVATYLTRNPGLSRVALEGDRIVGAVLCGHDGRRGFLYHLAVAPEFRGRGIGRNLVRECEEGLRASGIKRCLVLVANDNEAGRDFWTGQGFEIISALPLGRDV